MVSMNEGSWHYVLILLCVLGWSVSVTARPKQAKTGNSNSKSKIVEGIVVEVTSEEMIVDVGRNNGIPPSAEMMVFRRVEVEHPVTEKTITDEFPIGKVEFRRVGEKLSIARKWSALERKPSVGDRVVYRVPHRNASRSDKQQPKTLTVDNNSPIKSGGNTSISPERKRVEQTFQKTLGKPLGERIDIWQGYLENNPDSPFASQIGREVKWLRTKLQKIRTETSDKSREEPPVTGRVSVAHEVTTEEPIAISTTLSNPERVKVVRALVRRGDRKQYETLQLQEAGSQNWRLELSDKWAEPGRIEFFVEAVDKDNKIHHISSNAERPSSVKVKEPADIPADRSGRSRAQASFEYVNFNLGDGTDQFYQVESDYRYALDLEHLIGFRMGVGIFQGEGADLDTIESGGDTREQSVSYGYAELLTQAHEHLGWSFRLIAGNQSKAREDTSLEGVFGFSNEFRIGRADRTHLLVGGALTENIGNEAWMELNLETIENVPMSGEVVVTNLPVGEDLGVSLKYGVGYEVTDWVTLNGKVGWNARTINHHGPSVGTGLAVDW
jgi:hypothetical protein